VRERGRREEREKERKRERTSPRVIPATSGNERGESGNHAGATNLIDLGAFSTEAEGAGFRCTEQATSAAALAFALAFSFFLHFQFM
jgi:hypothetical protein